MSGTTKGLQLRSLIKKSGELELSLAEVPIPEPGPDQVLVKVEATPINPSDLGLLLGPADMSTAKASCGRARSPFPGTSYRAAGRGPGNSSSRSDPTSTPVTRPSASRRGRPPRAGTP